MEDERFSPVDLLDGFTASGGWINSSIFGLRSFPNMGYGAVALRDIPAKTPLFVVPNRLILSGYGSDLDERLSEEESEALGHGWARLILVMMWEESKGQSSRWGWYLRNMPSKFETPMLWSPGDLEELKGTDIENRIGKAQAEEDYRERILPILQAHSDLFPSSSPHFTLESYHLQGSRILSRSFTMSRPRASRASNRSATSATRQSRDPEQEQDEWEEEDELVPAMIPIADMLNAAYQRDNARLYDLEDFDDEEVEKPQELDEVMGRDDGFTMLSESEIKLGDQIFNTYDSPPNSELLRKHGHVDVFPLEKEVLDQMTPEEIGDWPYGNPGDEVEVTNEEIIRAAQAIRVESGTGELSQERVQERMEAWLENEDDDTFNISIEEVISPQMVAYCRLFLYDEDWSRLQRKWKTPRTRMDLLVGKAIQRAADLRLQRYATDLETDLRAMNGEVQLSDNHKRATIVRIGEKRLLYMLKREAGRQSDDASAKRKGEEDERDGKRSRLG